jgi:hypothetical protein
MKKEIADKWIEALESGKYKQTKGALKDSKGHCCLGVLCELAVVENMATFISKRNIFDQYQYTSIDDTNDVKDGVLPKSVMDWAGMKTDYGYRGNNGRDLFILNDDEGYSFIEIAEVIRKEYEDL